MGNGRLSSVRVNIIPVYFRTIQGATTNINRDINAANRTFNQYDFELFSLGQETNNVPALLDLDQPICDPGQTPTNEENQLFNLGRNQAPADIIVYYLRSSSLDVRGCAAFPANRPGCVVTDAANQWTLAHELGHMLGLEHMGPANNLMFSPTTDITADPPFLTEVQQNTIRASRFLV